MLVFAKAQTVQKFSQLVCSEVASKKASLCRSSFKF